jgi:hypothetical protein
MEAKIMHGHAAWSKVEVSVAWSHGRVSICRGCSSLSISKLVTGETHRAKRAEYQHDHK